MKRTRAAGTAVVMRAPQTKETPLAGRRADDANAGGVMTP